MENKTVKVPNISCHHCVMTIERELKELEGVVSVNANAETKEQWAECGFDELVLP